MIFMKYRKTIFCERMKSLVEERKSLMEERKLLVQKDKSLNQYLTSLRERLLSQSKKDSLLPPPKKARYTEPLFEGILPLHILKLNDILLLSQNLRCYTHTSLLL